MRSASQVGVALPSYLDRGVVSVGCLQPVSHRTATPLSLAADIPGPRAIQRDTVHSRTPVADAGSKSRDRQSSGERLAKDGADRVPAWPDHHPQSFGFGNGSL